MEQLLVTFSQALPGTTAVPDWLHLCPAGTFTGADGRGPFELKDPAAVVAASSGRKLPVDENHAIDHLGPKGGSSPARAWIVELQARDDGIWGRVEWTGEGRRLMEDRASGFVSPALIVSQSRPHRVVSIARASLVNDPNLTALKSLHAKEGDPMEEELRAALGLPATADKAAILTAVSKAHADAASAATLHAKLAAAVGLAKDATSDQLVASLQAKGQGGDGVTIAALGEQITALNSRLAEVTTGTARKEAETAIGAAIQAGKIVPALREHYVERHMKDAAGVEKEIAVMISLNAGGLRGHQPPAADGKVAGDDAAVCEMMGLDPVKFAETAKTMRGL